MRGSALRLEHVCFSYGQVEVLRDITLSAEPGELIAIVGPSGCGKTTLLNLMSGHLVPDAGRALREGTVRTVHEQDGLFPWMTVSQNIGLGVRRIPDAARAASQVRELLSLIRLEEFAGHYPHQLSAGMRQRVELARALAGESGALLMDEPFRSLDYQTRLQIRAELARLLALRPRTVALVTHDIAEAAQLADRVVVLSERPARIRRIIGVDLPRPRDPTHPEVVRAEASVLDLMGLIPSAWESPAPAESRS